jgi:tripartite-type tricarboxylate transporter receptor subunit TctC
MKKQRHLSWISVMIFIGLFITGLAYEGTNCQAAEKYPSRAIQVIIGYEPGSTDQALKPFIDKMAEVLGQPMNFVFKPGAGASIAGTYVASSKPDGYTLMGASLGPLITSPLTMKGINYTLEDFTPLCRTSAQATALMVKPDARWKTLKEFIDEAKKTPGKLNYATSGVLGTNHIPMEMLQKAAGCKLTHIPTTGSGAVLTALLGGHVDMGLAPMNAAAPQLKSGQLRALAFIHTQKVADYPDVPTLVELGYPITYSGYFVLVGPKGMPADVVQTLIGASDRVMEVHKKEIQDQWKNLSLDTAYLKGEDLAKLLRTDRDNTKKIIDEIQKSGK